MNILIAEDDPVSMGFLKKILEKWEYIVFTAEDGCKALEVFRENHVDMIITDWMMPEMDGIELCQKIRDLDTKRYIYTIIVTAKKQIRDKVEGFEAGADDFLTKPFDREELKSRIEAGKRILELENSLRRKNQLLEEANRRIMEDLKYAAKIQRSLLPNNLPKIKGVDICWEFFPCDQLGGDMLNVLRLDENRYGLYVLDVSGHGVPAALFSVALSRLLSETRDILKIRISEPPYYQITSPKDVLESLNKQFPMDLNTGQYFTILYGIIDISRHTFHWSNAGHPNPIMINESEVELITDAAGPPIGFFKDVEYQEGALELNPSQRILMYSDGILEALNQYDQQFTIDRLTDIIEDRKRLETKDLLSNLISEVEEWTKAKGGLNDDVTLLGLEIVKI